MSRAGQFNFIKRSRSSGPCLVPANIMSEEWLQHLKLDREVLVSIDTPRNPKHNALFHAMLNIIVENTDGKWRSIDDLKTDLKHATGLVEKRINQVTGQAYTVAKSTSFASMTQEEFGDWFELVVELIARNELGIRSEELMDKILEMAGQ